MKFLKTVIGSFPPKKVPIGDAIKCAVDLQLKHGINLVSDGEQRADMVSYFSSLRGLGMKPHGPFIKSRVLPLEDPKNFVKLRDLQLVREHLKSIRRKDVKVKVSVTGPISLGFFCAVNGLQYYSNLGDMRLYSDFAQALNPLILEIAKTGCYLQIDEPSLSTKVMDSKDAVKIVNEALSGIPSVFHTEGKLAVHICGPLSDPLFTDLLGLDVPVLGLAFGAPNVRKNFEVISKSSLQAGGKRLGIGCISVQAAKKEDVESLATVVSRLRAIRDRIGSELIALLHPDCGLRNTGEDAVEPILEMLASSANLLEKDEQTK